MKHFGRPFNGMFFACLLGLLTLLLGTTACSTAQDRGPSSQTMTSDEETDSKAWASDSEDPATAVQDAVGQTAATQDFTSPAPTKKKGRKK
ncbi:MAG: hypothetical protein J6Y94_04765 [Bacteriovoracaceae bacterium]|nr:hypothetical protein [Bacteriovoracaceae bacterium]